MGIQERNDVIWAYISASTDNDDGHGYRVGFEGVTEMRIVKRHGPLDFMPYVEVYRGGHLFAEVPQYKTLCVEFRAPQVPA
ncbi:hypothetical protein [Sphingomonas sp. 10B4]|uniref:hypothetical protein n=1 Tax=Sphingomonas sp. 10B4 TaxID=3048575 RepID=UPI002AB563B6|nr:hypothetical protein [Sphingomonas sp. 10B4]MDY7525531.1 hypothetical protein [Sphingomonas sp. 10B4]MEB0281477.1 hypothetical protein [Sphingomonas sp. 10B4]